MVVAATCVVCMSLGLAPLFMGTFPLFLQPVSQTFNWGAATYPQSVLFVAMAAAIAGPFVGRLIDRWGARPIILLSLLVWASSVFALSLLNGSPTQMFVIAVFMGVSAAACGPIALAKIIAGWFDRHRGLALGIVLSATPAIVTALLIVMTDPLIATYGWRNTYRIFAAAVVCIAVPATYFFIREAPNSIDAGALSDPTLVTQEAGPTLASAFRSREFLLILLVTCLISGIAQALVSHFVAWSAEQGVSTAATTTALSLYSLLGPVGPLLAGVLGDRVHSPKPLLFFYSLPLVALSLLFAIGTSVVIPAMAILGIGFNAAVGLLPFLVTRYFGVRHASSLLGVGFGIQTFSMALGPVILGWAQDRVHSFNALHPPLLMFAASALGLSLFLRQYSVRATP